MSTTANLALNLVAESENFDIDVWNGNMQKMDDFAGTVSKRTTLYDNSDGSSGTVALNSSAANYRVLEIMCKTNDGYIMPTVQAGNGQIVLLSSVCNSTSGATPESYFKSAVAAISGTTITMTENIEWRLTTQDITPNVKPIFITKVVGVKGQ